MHLFVKILYRCFSYKYMHTCMHTYIRTYMYIHTIYSIFLNVCSSGFKKKWMMWCSMWMMWCHAMAYYVKPAVLWFALLPSAMLCYVPSCEAMYCHAMRCSVMPCCAVVFHIVIVRFHYALKCAVFCCAVLRCDMICCVVACYDMLCCVMLCCALSGPVCFAHRTCLTASSYSLKAWICKADAVPGYTTTWTWYEFQQGEVIRPMTSVSSDGKPRCSVSSKHAAQPPKSQKLFRRHHPRIGLWPTTILLENDDSRFRASSDARRPRKRSPPTATPVAQHTLQP